MTNIRISDFEPGATRELVLMWRASFEHGVGVVDPHSIEEQAAFFEAEVRPVCRVRLAWSEGRLVGFLASTRESISQLHVHVDHLRQGIGSQLLCLAQAESSGTLWLHAFARNTNARRFYESHGFRAAERGFDPFWQLEDVKYLWRRIEKGAA
jgi:ribosomal protein S18 acetylase RimI-like enzyme